MAVREDITRRGREILIQIYNYRSSVIQEIILPNLIQIGAAVVRFDSKVIPTNGKTGSNNVVLSLRFIRNQKMNKKCPVAKHRTVSLNSKEESAFEC